MIYCPISKNKNCEDCDFNDSEKFKLTIDNSDTSNPSFSIESSVDDDDDLGGGTGSPVYEPTFAGSPA